MHDNLVELMVDYNNNTVDGVEFKMRGLIDIVLKNIHLIAKVCPECCGDSEIVHLMSNDGGFGGGVISNICRFCKGHGVVAREK